MLGNRAKNPVPVSCRSTGVVGGDRVGKMLIGFVPHRNPYGRVPLQTGRRRRSYPRFPSPGITTCAM